MYAVIETGGKQYRVSPGDVIAVERLPGEVGSRVELGQVLMVSEDGDVKIGRPVLAEARVVAEIVAQGRGPKVVVFKLKRRKNYRRKKGHRQGLTQLRIKEIIA